jgi:uncharacterized integral membrane protein
MKSTTKVISILIFLFLVIVFLDQNRTPVPVKILLGNPFHVGLSLIILISMVVAVVMTIGGVYLWMNRRKDKR